MLKTGIALSLVTLASLGCAHVVVEAAPMNEGEAVQRGYNFCSSHGLACRLSNVALTGRVWQLNYTAESAVRAGNLHLELDAYSRGLIAASEPPLRALPPPPVARPAPMTEAEAVQRGYGFCQQSQLSCQLTNASLAGNVWQLNFAASSPSRAGNLHLALDRFTRAVVQVVEPPPRVVAAPPPPARMMTQGEATERGYEFCRSRHYNCQLMEMSFANGRIWRINYRVNGTPHGRVHIEYDAVTRQVVNLNEDVRSY